MKVIYKDCILEQIDLVKREADIDDKPSRLVVKTLENEIRRHKETRRLLEEAEKVIEFYAEGNSHYDSKYEWTDSLGTATIPSGEMARGFLKKITDIKLDI